MLVSRTRWHISIDPLTAQPAINRRMPHGGRHRRASTDSNNIHRVWIPAVDKTMRLGTDAIDALWCSPPVGQLR
jgi:hypothetical protein